MHITVKRNIRQQHFDTFNMKWSAPNISSRIRVRWRSMIHLLVKHRRVAEMVCWICMAKNHIHTIFRGCQCWILVDTKPVSHNGRDSLLMMYRATLYSIRTRSEFQPFKLQVKSTKHSMWQPNNNLPIGWKKSEKIHIKMGYKSVNWTLEEIGG